MRLDPVFYASADLTRLAVIERLSNGPAPGGKLAQPCDMALPPFTPHLIVLENCWLVKSKKMGLARPSRLAPQPLTIAERWMVEQRNPWESRLTQLDPCLKSRKEETP